MLGVRCRVSAKESKNFVLYRPPTPAPIFKAMLTKRLISGFLLIPIVVFLIWWHPISFLILIIIVSSLMLLEFYALSENGLSNYEPKASIGKAKLPRLPALILGLGVCLSGFSEFSDLIPSDLILFASILAPMIYYLLKQEITASLIKISIFIFGIAYISWSFGLHMLLLRQLKNGSNLVLFLLAIVWFGDTGAYFLGSLLGKHKLIEAISPKKTVEGAIGGLCCSVVGGIIVQQTWLKEIVDLKNALILSIILALLAQISDLCESILKRSANVKDSGEIIPGHGGMLDRCDSMIFATPVLYYYMVRIYS